MGIATYEVGRFHRDVTRTNGSPSVLLTAEASDLGIREIPHKFMLMGKDNQLHNFNLTETLRDGTVDNEVYAWRFEMSTRRDITVEILND